MSGEEDCGPLALAEETVMSMLLVAKTSILFEEFVSQK